MITLDVNGKKIEVSVAADTPLLWVLREQLQLTGTKFGCGKGLCGAITLKDGRLRALPLTPNKVLAAMGKG